jgi:hypothetical protein
MIRLAGEVGHPSHYLQQYFEELLNVMSPRTISQLNNLKMYYDRLPRKIPAYKEKINKFLDFIKGEIESIEKIDTSLLIETKKILQEAETLALEYANNPVKIYLEGIQSKSPILDKLKSFQKRFDNISTNELKDDVEPVSNSHLSVLKGAVRQATDELFIYLKDIFEVPYDDGIHLFKDIQPKLVEAGERMAALLQKPELHAELAEFAQLLKTQYNYNLVLKDIVGRYLALQAHPDLRTYEEELFGKFQNSEIDAFTAHHLLKEKIASLK